MASSPLVAARSPVVQGSRQARPVMTLEARLPSRLSQHGFASAVGKSLSAARKLLTNGGHMKTTHPDIAGKRFGTP